MDIQNAKARTNARKESRPQAVRGLTSFLERRRIILVSVPSESNQRPLPDPALCRTKPLDFCLVLECLVPSPSQCRYAVPFGDQFACVNPDRHHELTDGDAGPG